MKDYYRILGIPPGADAAAIKQAYRRLVVKFHPDKTNGDKHALAIFNEIKEAYETLTDPVLKNEYLQERWLAKANNGAMETAANTPDAILKKMIALHQSTAGMDAFRHDKAAFQNAFEEIINTETITTLNNFNETHINGEVVKQALATIRNIPPAGQQRYLHLLHSINGNEATIALVMAQQKRVKALLKERKIMPAIIFILLIIICMIIAQSK